MVEEAAPERFPFEHSARAALLAIWMAPDDFEDGTLPGWAVAVVRGWGQDRDANLRMILDDDAFVAFWQERAA